MGILMVFYEWFVPTNEDAYREAISESVSTKNIIWKAKIFAASAMG